MEARILEPLNRKNGAGASEDAIARLLNRRFGDGCIYLPKHGPTGLFQLAIECGYVSEDGYVTRKGRALLTRYAFD